MKQHYASRFHLAWFTDPLADGKEPWLWVGDRLNGSVRRRAPKNVGWARQLYYEPSDALRHGIERLLGERVEPHAATARVATKAGDARELPWEILRYIAWAAARSQSMRSLYESWIVNVARSEDDDIVEPPPEWVDSIKLVSRGVRMEHESLGHRVAHGADEASSLVRAGWRPRLSEQDFSEVVHLQAAYLQSRFFPQLRWHTLIPPTGDFFVLGDRPVVWGFADAFDLPPSAFRLPGVQLFAPLTSNLALFAQHAEDVAPDRITASDVNNIVGAAATRWIVGPTEQVVRDALPHDVIGTPSDTGAQ